MTDGKTRKLGPIVSSSHLAQGAMPSLSEFEFGLIMASHAFQRWMVRCMTAAGVSGLAALDVLVLYCSTAPQATAPRNHNDLTRALRMSNALEAGMIWVNSENVRHLSTPFGEVKARGIGRDDGQLSFDFYMQ